MIDTEKKIIENIAERRDRPDELMTVFKRVSPSSKHVFIGGAVFVVAVLFMIYIVSMPAGVKQKKNDNNERMMSRMMPSAAVTPGYIDAISKKEEKRARQKEMEARKEKKSSVGSGKGQNASVGSMMIYTSGGAYGSLGNLGIPLGTELQAVLEKTVISDDRAVPVIARITKAHRSGEKIVIPRNTRLFGSTQGMVEDRVHVKFTRLVFPDGTEHQFSGIALDSNGAGGVKGKMKKKRGRRGSGIVKGAMLGASSVFMPGGSGFADTAMRGAHRGASGELSRDFRHYRRTKAAPVVTLLSKTKMTVLVDRAI
jgi:hypothetical protein